MLLSAAALFLNTVVLSNDYQGRSDDIVHRQIKLGPGLQFESYLVALFEATLSGNVLESLDD